LNAEQIDIVTSHIDRKDALVPGAVVGAQGEDGNGSALRHEFSASSISTINKSLDESLEAFAERRLEESYPYLIVDARYERVREGGVIRSQAVLIAVGVDGEGRRQTLAVDLANRESRSSWRDFLSRLKARGLAASNWWSATIMKG
jgi:transposase-like protein